MAIIKIKNQQVLIDNEDAQLISQYKWHLAYGPRTAYARTSIRINQKYKKTFMHRLILGLTNPNIQVDHIDGNGLNNQKSNLRICTASENSRNGRAHLDAVSRYKGVSFEQNTWAAKMRTKEHYLCKRFTTECAAALQYDKWAKKYYGKFARLNFPNITQKQRQTIVNNECNTIRSHKRHTHSKYIGVSQRKNNNKWRAYIKFNNRHIELGSFDTEIKAAQAYNNFVINHNLNRRLNQID